MVAGRNNFEDSIKKHVDEMIDKFQKTEDVTEQINMIKAMASQLQGIDDSCKEDASLEPKVKETRRKLEKFLEDNISNVMNKIYFDGRTELKNCDAKDVMNIEMKIIKDHYSELKKALSYLPANYSQRKKDYYRRSIDTFFIPKIKRQAAETWHLKNPDIEGRGRGKIAGVLTGVVIGVAIVSIAAALAFPPYGIVVAFIVGCTIAACAAKQGFYEGEHKGGILNGIKGGLKGATVGLIPKIKGLLRPPRQCTLAGLEKSYQQAKVADKNKHLSHTGGSEYMMAKGKAKVSVERKKDKTNSKDNAKSIELTELPPKPIVIQVKDDTLTPWGAPAKGDKEEKGEGEQGTRRKTLGG